MLAIQRDVCVFQIFFEHFMHSMTVMILHLSLNQVGERWNVATHSAPASSSKSSMPSRAKSATWTSIRNKHAKTLVFPLKFSMCSNTCFTSVPEPGRWEIKLRAILRTRNVHQNRPCRRGQRVPHEHQSETKMQKPYFIRSVFAKRLYSKTWFCQNLIFVRSRFAKHLFL